METARPSTHASAVRVYEKQSRTRLDPTLKVVHDAKEANALAVSNAINKNNDATTNNVLN